MLGLDVSLHRSLLQQEIKRSRATFSNQIFILDLYLQCTVLTLRLASMCFFMVDFFLEVLQQMQQGIKKSPHNVSKSNSYSEQAPAGYLLYASWHCSFQKCYHKFCVTKHNIPMTILQQEEKASHTKFSNQIHIRDKRLQGVYFMCQGGKPLLFYSNGICNENLRTILDSKEKL